MFANERQNLIYELVCKNGAVTTANLVKTFGVSIETIRRDLLSMEQNRMLKRVHGGAIANGKMKHFGTLADRVEENNDLKRELAEAAADFINENDTIAIDSGSTSLVFIKVLQERFSSLTIVTYSLDIFTELCKFKDFKVILCAGHFMKDENTFFGSFVLEALEKIHVQKSFVFTSAVSLKHGICDFNQDLLLLQKKLLSCSDDVFVLADSSKFESTALLKLDEMKNEYTYITDTHLSEELRQIYSENGIRVVAGGIKK